MREEILAAKLVKEVKFRVARVAGEALVLQVLREIISNIHKGSLQENARTSNFDIKIGRSSKLLDQLVVGSNGLSVRLWCSKEVLVLEASRMLQDAERTNLVRVVGSSCPQLVGVKQCNRCGRNGHLDHECNMSGRAVMRPPNAGRNQARGGRAQASGRVYAITSAEAASSDGGASLEQMLEEENLDETNLVEVDVKAEP
ncbi:hypothetical protein LR48_Vigan05g014600 [Vigna angularis]|uniref:CCHC-type domain-containing protein n=1 Tax=Phaseolus angularis TaxID=3914 RepID=A0A0L9UJ23_PHAAN|nr:hypothetical protein LR48_Vigan05g014600 [Vigna angularis]